MFCPLGSPVCIPGAYQETPPVCSLERPRTTNSREWTRLPVSAAIAAARGRRLPTRISVEGREPGRGRWRAGGGQAEMAEDALDNRCLVDEGDDLAAATAGTSEDVLAEDAKEQLAPRHARVGRAERLAVGARLGFRLARRWGRGRAG